MAADPTAQPAPPTLWQQLRPYVIRAAILLAGGLVAVLVDRGLLPRAAVELVKEVPAAVPLIDSTPIDYEGLRFDGGEHDHHHAQPLVSGQQAQAARWPADRITYSVDYASARGINPPLSDAAIQTEARVATGWWSEQLQLEFVEVPYPGGMIPCRFERIDGPGGVLAEAYLADGSTRPKPLRLDVTERWVAGPPAANQIALRTVWCHEIGHSLGCDHDATAAVAVMRPTYSASIPREQERDIARMVQLGYKRREKVPPAPTDLLTVAVQIKTTDMVDALRSKGFTVNAPLTAVEIDQLLDRAVKSMPSPSRVEK